MINREQIAGALFSKISTALSFPTMSRFLRHWTDVNPPEYPCFFMALNHYTNEQPKRGFPPRWLVEYHLWVYVLSTNPYDPTNPTDPKAVPSVALNNALDSIEGALAPSVSTGVQDLGLGIEKGGMVQHCWLSGTALTDEGTLGSIGVMRVPVSILAV